MCISGIYINIAMLQNPTAINISFSADTIVVVQENAIIFDLQWRLYDRRNRDSLLQRFCLVIAAGWTATIDLLTPYLSLNLLSVFFWAFILAPLRFCQKQCISISLSFTVSLSFIVSISFTLEAQNPTQTLFISSSLSLSFSHSPSQTQNPTTIAAFTTTPPPPPPNHVDLVTSWQPQSTSLVPPSNPNPPCRCHLISIHLVSFLFFYFIYVICFFFFFIQCVIGFFVVCLVIYQNVLQ